MPMITLVTPLDRHHPRYRDPMPTAQRVKVRWEAPAWAGPAGRSTVRDLAGWLAIVVAGLVVSAIAVAAHARLGTASAPFSGRYRFKVDAGSLLAPLVAAAMLAGVRRGVHERLPWRRLLLAGYLAAVAWALALALVDGGNGLATPVDAPEGYLPDVARIGSDPLGFLRDFVSTAGSHTPSTRQHPPGPVLLLWGLTRLGAHSPALLGLLVTLIGCLAVPLVAVAVLSLCGERASRRLLPVLALAPYAVWLAVSLDAVTLTLGAGAVACGVRASEPRRSPAWAVAAGLLLGASALFSYSVGWLAASVIVVNFVRRRPLLNMITGASALLPLALAQLAGFTWSDGLTAAQADFSLRVEPHRSWLVWALLDLFLLAIACGPAVAASARKIRRTPGWPFTVGAGLAVVFAVGSGLSRGEVERSFLPFFPWLLVAAVAPEPGEDAGATPTPLLLIAVGAFTAIVIEAVLRTAW